MAETTQSVRVDSRKVIEKVACRAFLNADQDNITDSAWNKVNLNDTTYDLGENFDTSTNYRFDVPVDGLYKIHAVVRLVGSSVVADKQYAVGIFINGTESSYSGIHASVVDDLSISKLDELYLEKDDYVEIKVYPHGAGGDTVDIDGDANGLYTYAIFRLVTREGVGP
jgi:hypothetical protein